MPRTTDSFAEKGVPSPTFPRVSGHLGKRFRKYYHQPSDQADENFDFAYLQRFCEAFVRSAHLIADRPDQADVDAGDRFEKAAGKSLCAGR